MSRRRGLPWLLLGSLFVVVPLVEIYVIIQVGQVIGGWSTLLLVVAGGFLGSYLVRREGGRAWRALQDSLASGRMPAKELADGALILVGGTLLLTPGFLTDVVGLVAILPFTRPLTRRVLAQFISRRITVMGAGGSRPSGFGVGFGPGGPGSAGPTSGERGRPGPSRPPQDPDVVEGEVVDDP